MRPAAAKRPLRSSSAARSLSLFSTGGSCDALHEHDRQDHDVVGAEDEQGDLDAGEALVRRERRSRAHGREDA